MTLLDRVQARPGETLTAHTLAVVARVEALERLRPLERYSGLYRRLRLAAWLHDSGKLAAGFQKGLQSRRRRWGLRHEVASLAFLSWLGLGEADEDGVIAAVATHHRDAAFILETYTRSSGRVERLTADLPAAEVRAWYDWLAAQGAVSAGFEPPQADTIYAALDTLDRWVNRLMLLGADHPDFTEAVLLRGLMLQADHAAAAGFAQPLTGAILDREAIALRTTETPHPHQTAAAAAEGSLVLRAPTGAGKTEAALLWAARSPAAPRLVYLLPYRASLNAMAERLKPVASGEVALRHGRALSALYRRALDDGASADDALSAARARLALARLHACPVGVYSPYHLLRALYRCKGHEAMLADLYGARLIVDEIHAYEPERLALVLGMLRLLTTRLDAQVLIMTATLPPLADRAIRAALGDLARVEADHATCSAFQRHCLVLRTGDLMDEADTIAAESRATLVVVNTVRRALMLSARLREGGAQVLTLHGRFNTRDRWRIERELLAAFRLGAARAGRPPILVATQVVEVSLDLDFDVLYSDPAPLDALFQRFGRVNRVCRLSQAAPVIVYTQPTGAETRHPIYSPTLVEASLEALADIDGAVIDESRTADLLDRAYAGVADAWQTRYETRLREFETWVARGYPPFETADVGLTRQFLRLFDECLVLPLSLEDEYTRLRVERPLEADDLRVPLAWGQYRMLERAGRAWMGDEEDAPLWVDLAYSTETGLDMTETTAQAPVELDDDGEVEGDDL